MPDTQPSASALSDEQLTEILRKWSIKNKIFTLHYIWEDLKRDLLAALAAPVSEPIYQRAYADGLWEDVAKKLYDVIHEDCRRIVYTAPPQAVVAQPVDARDLLIAEIAQQKPEKPDHWSSCSQCEHNIEKAQDIIDAAQSPQAKAGDKHD